MPEQPPFWQDPRWIVTTLLALYGAALATYQQIQKRREKEPRVRIAFWPSSGGLISGPTTEHHLSMKVKNLGSVDLWFKPGCCSIETEPIGEHFVLPDSAADVTFPYVLKGGDSFSVTVGAHEFYKWVWEDGMEELPPMRALATDALGREFTSDWRQFRWSLGEGKGKGKQ